MTARSPLSLRIAILGVGNIGSAFAFKLVSVGKHEVTAVVRPGSVRLKQLERDGAIVLTSGERASVHVADALDESIPYDLVLVTLLTHQVDAVLPSLQRSAAKTVHFMANHFDPERLARAVGTGRCVFGMPFVQVRLRPTGTPEGELPAPPRSEETRGN